MVAEFRLAVPLKTVAAAMILDEFGFFEAGPPRTADTEKIRARKAKGYGQPMRKCESCLGCWRSSQRRPSDGLGLPYLSSASLLPVVATSMLVARS